MSGDEILWRGKRVVWRHKPRGGYGYVMRIPVTIVERRGSRVVIRLDTGAEMVVRVASIIQPEDMRNVTAILESPEVNK